MKKLYITSKAKNYFKERSRYSSNTFNILTKVVFIISK